MSFFRSALVAALATPLALAGAPARADGVTFILNLPNQGTADATDPLLINAAGNVAGSFIDTSFAAHGFTYIGGVLSQYDIAGATATHITALSSDNSFAGTSTNGTTSAFYKPATGSVTTIGAGLLPTVIANVQGNNFILGNEIGGQQRAFQSLAGTAPTYVAINNLPTTITAATPSGVVTGYNTDTSGNQQAFVFSQTSAIPAAPTGAISSTITVSNSAKQFAGTALDGTSFVTEGFIGVGAAATIVQAFGSTFTDFTAINDSGIAVGFYLDDAGFQHGLVDVNGALETFDPAGATSVSITGINNAGQIVGTYDDATGAAHVFIAQVPEPSALAVLGAGLLGLAGLRRRSRG